MGKQNKSLKKLYYFEDCPASKPKVSSSILNKNEAVPSTVSVLKPNFCFNTPIYSDMQEAL